MFIWVCILFIFLIFSAIIHECAHAWAAYRLGDPTAAQLGRITLDPRPHIDPFMTIIMPLLTLLASGGRFIFGGAKPVPINPYNFSHPEKGMMLSSLAGPFSNLIMALLAFGYFLLLANVQILTGKFLSVNYFLITLFIFINLILTIFNLIPIPPLDGSRVLRYFLPWHMKESLDRMETFGMIIVFMLLFMGGFQLIRILRDFLLKLLYTLSHGDVDFGNLLVKFFYPG